MDQVKIPTRLMPKVVDLLAQEYALVLVDKARVEEKLSTAKFEIDRLAKELNEKDKSIEYLEAEVAKHDDF